MKLARVRRGLTYERLWALVVLDCTLADVLAGAPPTGRYLYPPERDLFWADPFPVHDAEGRLWIFVEEMHRWRGLGEIVALRIADGQVVNRTSVLRSRHHYSFPQAHFHEGTWTASAETCDPAAPMYTFTAPGAPWAASLRTLPPRIIDPAVGVPESGSAERTWYLTATAPDDYFAGFRAWQAEEGVGWEPVAEQSFRDAALARPAGNADLVRGLRSVQDCSDNYGIATSIIEWDPRVTTTPAGPGAVRRRLTGDDFGHGALGTHTLSWTPDGEVVVADVWKRGPQVWSGAHRVLEQRHSRVCRRSG